MKSLIKKTIVVSIFACFFSIESFSQNTNSYKECTKSEVSPNFLYNLNSAYIQIASSLDYLMKSIDENKTNEIKIKYDYDKIVQRIRTNYYYLESLRDASVSVLNNQSTKVKLCEIFFEMKTIEDKIKPIREISSRIYQENEVKNNAKERLSRQ